MGLDLWFREDVARILASTQETMRASQAASGVNEAYQQGFVDALRSVAVAFGITAPHGPVRRREQWQQRSISPTERGEMEVAHVCEPSPLQMELAADPHRPDDRRCTF